MLLMTELPEEKDSVPRPMGEARTVIDQISRVLPGIEWFKNESGIYDGDGFLFEIGVGDESPVEAVMLGVRGGGDPVTSIVKLCRECGWVAFDCSTGELIDLNDPSDDGWQGFQAFRDKVIPAEHQGPFRLTINKKPPNLIRASLLKLRSYIRKILRPAKDQHE